MTLVILGATGGTGRHLVARALASGLDVRALARNPDTARLPVHPRLQVVRADVHDAASIAAAIDPGDIVLSGLGVSSKAEVGTLEAGATAVVAARPAHIVWLGATGTGPSAEKVGSGIAWMLRKGFGAEYGDKTTGDAAVLAAGGSVVHSGPLNDKADDPRVILRPGREARQRFFPHGAPRVSVARLMLDLAQAEPSRSPKSGLFVVGRA